MSAHPVRAAPDEPAIAEVRRYLRVLESRLATAPAGREQDWLQREIAAQCRELVRLGVEDC